MTRSTIFARESTRSIRDLTRQVSDMQAALRRLSDQAGSHGPIYAPQIRQLRSVTKRSVTKPSALESALGGGIGSYIGGNGAAAFGFGDGVSFYDSASQIASQWTTQFLRGGRVS